MKELAAAIAAKVPGATNGNPSAPAPLDSKGSRETTEANEPATTAAADGSVAQLQQLTKGLVFMSESEAPLEPVSYAAPAGELTDAAALKLLGEPTDAKVETQELTLFLRNHTADNGVLGDPAQANRFKALQMFMKQDLQDTKVYRIGTGPQVKVYALGKTEDGKLAGFKTVLTET
nr:nuclease A inhibitor family protein [Hymenobacter norwichensis]